MRVGVLVATYQGERFVSQQLQSILEQTRSPDLIVITDDGSDDRTIELCLAITKSAPCQVVYDFHEHVGLSQSLSRGLEHIGTDLVFLADQDDRWHRQKIERVHALFEADPAALVTFHDGDLIGSQGETLGGSLWSRAGLRAREISQLSLGDPLPVLVRWNPITGAAMALHRRLLDLALPFPEAGLHDAWFGLMAAAQGGLRPLRQHLMSYRVHSGNLAGLVPERRWDRVRQRRSRADVRAIEETLFASAAERVGPITNPTVSGVLRAKADFCRFRRSLPLDPGRRLQQIARQVRLGEYARFTKHAGRSIAFDLLGGEQALVRGRA